MHQSWKAEHASRLSGGTKGWTHVKAGETSKEAHHKRSGNSDHKKKPHKSET